MRRFIFRSIARDSDRSTQRGAAVVEFAITLPLILMLLLGIVEFGRMLSVLHLLNIASREGARVAVLPGADNTRVTNRINDVLSSSGFSGVTVTLNPSDVSSAGSGDPVQVLVQVPYSNVMIFGGFLGFGNLTLSGNTVMRKEAGA